MHGGPVAPASCRLEAGVTESGRLLWYFFTSSQPSREEGLVKSHTLLYSEQREIRKVFFRTVIICVPNPRVRQRGKMPRLRCRQ